jgi:hypothetical protein
MIWRFRGTSSYLAAQAKRLGVQPILAERARTNPEIYHVSVLLAQVCELYHRVPKEDGEPIFTVRDVERLAATIAQCEMDCEKLHMLAAASSMMISEAYAAIGAKVPRRPYRVCCDHDDARPIPPPGETTPAVNSLTESG